MNFSKSLYDWAIAITCAVIVSSIAINASAHDWYPSACCGGKDCHPIPCEEVKFEGDEIVWQKFRGKKGWVAPSLDDRCHICIIHDSSLENLHIPGCWFMPREKTPDSTS
jgi:hypothetical protein